MRNLVLMLALVPGLAAADRLRGCAPGELEGPMPGDAEVEAHRQAPLPMPAYPEDKQMEGWGFYLTLAIDARGAPTCYIANSGSDEPAVVSTPQREALYDSLASWRYRPFLRGGKAVPVVIEEMIEEAVAQAPNPEPLPEVPAEQVRISLDRSTCLGACPAYTVEVGGDGRVVFTGRYNVDVLGRHEYAIAPGQARELIERLRRSQLWSRKSDRHSIAPDAQFTTLGMRFGAAEREVVSGLNMGPQIPGISAFEKDFESLAGVQAWKQLTPETVVQLRREGFDFRSKDGKDLLLRAMANDETRDEAGLLALVAAGVRLDPQLKDEQGYSLLERALSNGRLQLATLMIERGALTTLGKPDRAKIDAAFRTAIRGAHLAAVELVWNAAGPQARPSLVFQDERLDDKDEKTPASKSTPVTMILTPPWFPDPEWRGFEVAKWLVARGADPKAASIEGKNLLNTAVDSGEGEFASWVLAQGLDWSGIDASDLADADEDVALALLEAGYARDFNDEQREELREAFEYRNRQRAMAWLVRHPH